MRTKAIITLVVSFVVMPSAHADSYTYTRINSLNGQLLGINDHQALLTGNSTSFSVYNSNGQLQSQYNYPSIGTYEVKSFNDNGQAVGYLTTPNGIFVANSGFEYSNGVYTSLNDPNSAPNLGSYASGINDQGQIVGWYFDSVVNPHAFIYTNGQYDELPSYSQSYANEIYPAAISNNGVVVGSYVNLQGSMQGFEYSNGVYTSLSDPSGQATTPVGINNSGQVVGYYTVPDPSHPFSSGTTYGFIYSQGAYTTLNAPDAKEPWCRPALTTTASLSAPITPLTAPSLLKPI